MCGFKHVWELSTGRARSLFGTSLAHTFQQPSTALRSPAYSHATSSFVSNPIRVNSDLRSTLAFISCVEAWCGLCAASFLSLPFGLLRFLFPRLLSRLAEICPPISLSCVQVKPIGCAQDLQRRRQPNRVCVRECERHTHARTQSQWDSIPAQTQCMFPFH